MTIIKFLVKGLLSLISLDRKITRKYYPRLLRGVPECREREGGGGSYLK